MRDKLVGTFVVPGGFLGLPILLLGTGGGTCSSSSSGGTTCTGGTLRLLAVLLLLVLLLGPLLGDGYLLWRLRRRGAV